MIAQVCFPISDRYFASAGHVSHVLSYIWTPNSLAATVSDVMELRLVQGWPYGNPAAKLLRAKEFAARALAAYSGY